MQGFLTICAVMGAVGLAACGSPSGLDDASFPSIDKTGYPGAGSATTEVARAGQGGSSAVASSSGGSAGSLVSANGGGTPTGTGANTGATSGGTGSSGCPADITTLFARPIAQGGCTSGGGCHEATSPIKPDLVSPNVAARLLNVASRCTKTSSGMSVPARPYISKDDSFLEEKIAGSPDSSCGYSMPFLMPDALSAADEQCIIQWIDQVAGG